MDATERLAQEGGEAQRRKLAPRTANPYSRGSKYFDLWDTAWCDEDDRLKQVVNEALFGYGDILNPDYERFPSNK